MRRLVVAAALAAAVLLSQFVAVPATAGGSAQCKGYAACEAAGKSNFGYAAASSTEYWRMVSGHNCTNYAAYRLIQNGHAYERPWDGNGNATAWGDDNADITDQTPTVGAIAWWAANDNGAGAAGHVSYVQRVVSNDRIVVSEDNYGGDFYWKVVDRKNSDWPTGFVHLKDEQQSASFPAFRARALAQSVWTDSTKKNLSSTGRLEPGSTAWVTASWRNTGDETWVGTTLRAASIDALGSAWATPGIAATQSAAPVVTGATVTFGFPITIPAGVPDGTPFTQTFTVADAAGTPIGLSPVTMTFTADSRDPLTAIPVLGLSGAGREGTELTALEGGGWAPVQPLVGYQWTRDDVPIPGAVAPTYLLGPDDVGHRVGVTSTTTAPGFLPVERTAAYGSTIRSQYPSTLLIKGRLKTDVQLVSANGVYKLVHGKKGNLALVNRFTKKTVWSSKVFTKKPYTRLRGDGVLVTYSASGKAVWKTTSTKKAVRAVLTNTGKLVLYTKSGSVAWKTPTPKR